MIVGIRGAKAAMAALVEAEDRLREELVETWRRSLTQYAKLHSQEVSEAT